MKKLTTIDYAVMFGGPAIFIAIAILGIRSLLGSAPVHDSVKLLRDGAVKPGMTQTEVVSKVGQPKSTVENTNGSLTFRYQHGTWDADRHTFVEEDGYVDFDQNETVSGVSFEARTPPQPK